MMDKYDNIIYVGKAVILKNRVKQYFQKTNKTVRIQRMVSLIDHFEYIVTDNEAEALILECNLIKKNRPKFNVLLKDDKTYPYIKIDIQSDYPTVFITRRIQKDGAKYFGPYSNQGAAKEMVEFIKNRFQIRQCKNLKMNRKPCLNYHIKKCLAPCAKNVSKEEYNKQIQSIIMLLEGKTKEILDDLDKQMYELSENQEYEKAAIIRDRKIAIEQITEKQKVSNINENSIDVIGFAINELFICVELFFIRNSKMIGREHYFFEQDEINREEFLSDFVKQYYLDKIELPSKIFIQEHIEDKELIEEILSKKADKKVEFKTPQKGEKLRLVEMAENNAKITLENRTKTEENILLKLQECLKLEKLPTKIECFDISNLSRRIYGTDGMCVAINGKIKKNLGRKFKIKTVLTQNDPKCLEEVVTRRLGHSINETSGAFGKLPDIIFADGGITQIRAIKNAINYYHLDIPVFGMVKDDKHRTKMLIDEDRNQIKLNETLMNFVTNMQDEVHNIAIGYNRKLSEENITKSKLDLIKGIGEKKKLELLKKFGSVEEIKKSTIEEISKIKGINEELAKKIKKELY